MAGLAQGFNDPANAVWQGKLLKAEVLTEAGQFNSTINDSTSGPCGGQNRLRGLGARALRLERDGPVHRACRLLA